MGTDAAFSIFPLKKKSHILVARMPKSGSTCLTNIIGKYGLTPVALMRNLFDATVSFCGHLRNESLIWLMAYLTDRHKNLPDAELEEAIVRLVMPWRMSFCAGWRCDPDALFVSNVLKRGGIPPVPEKVRSAISAASGADNRFNVGISGRGKKISPKAAEGIRELISLYPEFKNDPYFQDMQSML
ncbi:MAG: hypothetical protein KGQ70_00075 [Alphaproteobacteria bacterium]|nr:hypothetical protein [Alphaproteobacteria bacterium]